MSMTCKFKWYLFLCLLPLVHCSKEKQEAEAAIQMQTLVREISAYTKTQKPGFLIIPQNGLELAFADLDPHSALDLSYVLAVDGFGVEELHYDGKLNPDPERITAAQQLGQFKPVLVAELINDPATYSAAVQINQQNGFLSFIRTADNHDYLKIPSQIEGENTRDIEQLDDAQNYLYIISTDAFATKDALLDAVSQTNYDVLLIDLFFEEEQLTASDLAGIRRKANGGKRLVIAYVNIGAAENYRYYWLSGWKRGNPEWLKKNYPGYPDEIYVVYWNQEWKDILFGDGNAYLDRIIAAGFDGAYLDNVEAYYFLYHK